MKSTLLLYALIEYAMAAHTNPTMAPFGLWRRQASSTSSSDPYTTMGYYSVSESDDNTWWAPYTAYTRYGFITSTGNYWISCQYSFSYASGTTAIVSTACSPWTSCSLGWLGDGTTSFFCAISGNQCFTAEIYDSLGATSGVTNFDCSSFSPNTTTITSIFRQDPRTVGRKTVTSTSNTGPVNPGSSIPAPTPIPTTNPSSTSVPASSSGDHGHNNNAGAIAGGVVGSIAVVGFIIMAILWVLRRNRNPPDPSSVVPATYLGEVYSPQPEKLADVPEYNPHMSAVYSNPPGTPPTHSPVQQHPMQFRNELSVVSSPH